MPRGATTPIEPEPAQHPVQEHTLEHVQDHAREQAHEHPVHDPRERRVVPERLVGRLPRAWRVAALLLVVGVSLPAAGTLGAVSLSRQAVEHRELAGERATAQALAQQAGDRYSDLVGELGATASRPSVVTGLPRRDRDLLLRSLRNVDWAGRFCRLRITDAAGRQVAELAPVPPGGCPPARSRTLLPDPLPRPGANGMWTAGPFFDGSDGLYAAGTVVHGDDGRVIGHLSGTFPVAALLPHVSMLHYGSNGRAGLVGSDGTLLLSRDSQNQGRPLTAFGLRRLVATGQPGAGSFFSPRLNTTTLVTWVPSEGGPFGVLVLTPRSEAFADADALARRLLVGLGVLTLVAVLIAALVGRRLARVEAEQARAQDALRSAYDRELQAVARLRDLDRAKTGFVSTVSHELRTPLTSVVGYVEMMMDGDVGPVSAPQRRMLGVVARNATRLLGLVEDLLTLSRIEAGAFRLTPRPTPLADCVHGALEALAVLRASRRLDLRVSLPEAPVIVLADAPHLERVVTNVLSNAIKFTPDGGAVSVVAGVEGDRARVCVSDTGVGIPLEEQHQLFSRFFRSTTAQDLEVQGTGLGLAIARTVVEQHGGEITVDSEPGEGTTVSFTLPLAAARERGRATTDEPAWAPVSAG